MRNNINNDSIGSIKFYDINFWIGENLFSERLTVNDNNLKEMLKERKNRFNIIGKAVTVNYNNTTV